jgi:hypothetical protein
MIYKYLLSLLLISFISPANAQVVHEPLHSDVYNYLRRLSQRGVIVFNDTFKPLSRKYISQKLIEAGEKSGSLTPLEKEELLYF